MSDFKNAANGSFGGKTPKFDSGDKVVNQAIALLEHEGFELREAASDTLEQVILLMNDKTDEAAVIMMSMSGYPYLSESGLHLQNPQLYRGSKHDIEQPIPVSVSKFVRDSTRKGPSAGPSPV